MNGLIDQRPHRAKNVSEYGSFVGTRFTSKFLTWRLAMTSARSIMWAVVLLAAWMTAAWSQQNPNTAAGSLNSSSTSQLPRLVKFNGVLKDVNGNPLSGTVGTTFLLYSEPSGGAPLWLETRQQWVS